MTDWDAQDPEPAEDDGVLEPADSLLTDRLDDDPLDTGVIPPDGYRGATAYGTTPEEAERGESLDQLLSEEEPDDSPGAVDDRWADGPSPRAGRLVEDGIDTEGTDVGPDAGAASAEEAAVHLVYPDEDTEAEFDDAEPDEPLREAVRFTVLDDLADRVPDDEYR
ncbi:DUF5709 domain-containing protein [Kitasatospora cineracea]|uniref:DUF5709 domain-containing protein n=1 Tax=Kitasatospora cineracea TaxID=88074 RepID=A0A3N4R4U0_9ACTN|nr:DUF5709 domain-containing protein [Kitasatospora cineracea]RPE27626.1 hypothetical protein EDD38_6911 [Kitasatospora cineracea]